MIRPLLEAGKAELEAQCALAAIVPARDPSNDETEAVAADPRWGTRLRCALQRHVVPAELVRALARALGLLPDEDDGPTPEEDAPEQDAPGAAPPEVAPSAVVPPGGGVTTRRSPGGTGCRHRTR